MLLDVNPYYQHLENKIKENVLKIKEKNRNNEIKFSIIKVGDLYASTKYINNKVKKAAELNIICEVIQLAENVTQKDLIQEIENQNNNTAINGIIVQLPLPKHLDEYEIIKHIHPQKDIDGLQVQNIGLMYLDQTQFVPCTAYSVIELLQYNKIELKGANIVIAGRSNLVGKALAIMLINLGATVTVANSKTQNIKTYLQEADIFISAIGSAHYYDQTYFPNPKITIIDVGINYLEGKMVGDVKYEEVVDQVAYLTKVPGGIGKLTVLQLLLNTVKAYQIQNKEN